MKGDRSKKHEWNRAKKIENNKKEFRVMDTMTHSTAIAEAFRDGWESFRSIPVKANGMRL